VGEPYKFKNDDGTAGRMTVATATQKSVNGAFVSMALQLDLCKIAETASSIGVHRADGAALETNPSSVLGTNTIAPLTMAAAYASIASGGTYCAPIAIDRLVEPDGTEVDGQTRDCTTQLEPEVANTAAFAMSKVMLGGGTATRSNPNDGVEYIGKTGTTDSSNQTWVVGASTRVATAVWVGNIAGTYAIRSYKNTKGVAGSNIRHDIFRSIATAVDDIPVYRATDFPDASKDLLNGSGKAVPEISGQTVEAATALLEGNGFEVSNGGAVDSAVPEGRAVRTDPAAGTLLSKDSDITLYTSNGALGSMPDVVGDGDNDADDAKQELRDAGFSNVSETCTELPEDQKDNDGKVISSTPAAGASVKQSDSVTLTIGKEKC
jgi:membrane peptidoglycan carboxypeptidase